MSISAQAAGADRWAARRNRLLAQRAAYERVLFVVLCLVWGTSWIALKAGAMAVPPGFFLGTRWTIAGLLMLAWHCARGQRTTFPLRFASRLVIVALLMIALNPVITLYALRYVSSGLAAVINSALMPIALLGFGVAAGQEQFNKRRLGAIALGVTGIVVLFGPSAFRGELDSRELLGAIGVIVSCLCYAAGSVLARPLMRSLSPAHVAASTNLVGGLMLLVASILFEPGAIAAASGHWGWAAWAAWLYMLGPASLGATTIYLLLVRDWGASRTGTYAFVSPVIAVLLGVAVYGERLDPANVVGMALMLVAAALVLRR